jgi:hypothetical protein
MKATFYAYATRSGGIRFTKKLGSVYSNEIPVKVNLEIPDANWKTPPIAEVNITYPTFVPVEPQGVKVSVEGIE